MENLIVHETPELKAPVLVMSFAGWPDAGEASTAAVRYLVHKFKASKFAEFNPEEFYDFTQTRPRTVTVSPGERMVHWPANEFFYRRAEGEGTQDMLLFIGVEPNLKWRTFSTLVVDLAERQGVKNILHMGALLDAVPHTRDTRLTGTSNSPHWRQVLETMHIVGSNYQGPTGITSAVWEACTRRNIGYASVWGHTPHYLQAAPNYKVSYHLLLALHRLLDMPIDLEELRVASNTFQEEVEKVVNKDPQVQTYVKRLEDYYDQTFTGPSIETPSPAEVVKELEDYLKGLRQRKGEGGQQGSQPPQEPGA